MNSDDINTEEAENPIIKFLTSRYKDAYKVAYGTISSGNSIKLLGVIVGIAVIVISLFMYSHINDKMILEIGTIAAVILGGQIYLFGILICAQGQLLLTSIDTAINTSPNMQKENKIEIIIDNI